MTTTTPTSTIPTKCAYCGRSTRARKKISVVPHLLKYCSDVCRVRAARAAYRARQQKPHER